MDFDSATTVVFDTSRAGDQCVQERRSVETICIPYRQNNIMVKAHSQTKANVQGCQS